MCPGFVRYECAITTAKDPSRCHSEKQTFTSKYFFPSSKVVSRTSAAPASMASSVALSRLSRPSCWLTSTSPTWSKNSFAIAPPAAFETLNLERRIICASR
uniref:Uncharacterized protein n=1 Tax=Schistocephalus solidus TaxID=70667 RepID=A0A0X3NV34_SCHSO